MPYAEFPEWLDHIDPGSVGLFTVDDGEQIAAVVVDFDLDLRELVVDVIPPKPHGPHRVEKHRAIPVGRIASFQPQPHLPLPWPQSDPCRRGPSSRARIALLTTLVLCLIPGSIPLFLLLADRPYGLQTASAIVYSLFEVFATFAALRGSRRLLFTCPAVQPQIPRLLWRHLGFLVTLFALQTAALASHPHLPDWWNVKDRKGSTPFEAALLLLCISLAYAQVFTSRSLLERAHREFST